MSVPQSSKRVTPKVSVAMTTYNHEKFIAQAIESVLMQKTSFPFELIIGEDCSTDGTRAIVQHYATKHPDLIHPVLQKRNLGARENGKTVRAACRGEYIAFLEGDDFWTAPDKLQKQIEFMDSRRNVTLCGHRVTICSEGEKPERSLYPDGARPSISTLADVVAENWIPTCSMVLRRNIVMENPEWIRNLPVGDWPLQVLAAKRGKIGFLDAVMGCYRVHNGGMWSGLNEIGRIENILKFYNAIRFQIPSSCWTKVVRPRLIELRMSLAEEYGASGDPQRARKEGWRAIFNDPKNALARPARMVAGLLKAYQFNMAIKVFKHAGRVFRHN